MSLLVVALLAILWAAVLLPGALRGRRDASPMSTIEGFERSMVMLAHRSQSRAPAGRQVLVPPPPRVTARGRAAQRRRIVLARLGLAVAGTGLLGAAVGGLAWLLFGAAVAVLGGYLYMLFQIEALQQEQRRKVRRLPRTEPLAPRALDLHELAVAEQGGHR